MIHRKQSIDLIKAALNQFPVVAIIGPRQCGKTTIIRELIQVDPEFRENQYFDCENPLDLERLQDPMLTLSACQGLVVIDEVQRLPELFPVLRVLIDDPKHNLSLIILGSASPMLLQQSSESLAGRIHYHELTPFTAREVHDYRTLWVRGGYPPSYLSQSDGDSLRWRESYIRTYLEQDIPNLGLKLNPMQLRRFWMMLAHLHGREFQASSLAHSLGIASTTVQRYFDLLHHTYMVRQLQPWLANIAKRQVKSKKCYFRDSGLLHALQQLNSWEALSCHPSLGMSWEGFAQEQLIHAFGLSDQQCYFWAVHAQGELDLLVFDGGKTLGFEFKYTNRPNLTKSMRMASECLKLDQLVVVSPGNHTFPLSDKTKAMGFEAIMALEMLTDVCQ